ncbi:hypothetical protein EG831_05700 [bacterium]|nr:hypothetical protein [bacterium]
MNPSLPSSLSERLAQATICLLASLPFLLPWHTMPIGSFHQEWLAAVLGIVVVALALGGTRPLVCLPRVAALPLLLLGAVLVQWQGQLGIMPGVAKLALLYLGWGTALMVAARHLGASRVMPALAWGLFLGALAAALLTFAGLVPYGPRQGGPLAQANHFADYLWLGAAAGLYLRGSGRLPSKLFWPGVLPVVAMSVLAGSRSPFLYALSLALLAHWAHRRLPAMPRRPAWLLVALYIALQPLPTLFPLSPDGVELESPTFRLQEQAKTPSIRLQLLEVAFNTALAHPSLGAGVGNWPVQAAEPGRVRPDNNPGVAEHAHNLPMQLAAEFGLPVTFALLAGLTLWMQRTSRLTSAEATFGLMLATVLGIHSLLEYPLWYAHFLAIASLTVGALDTGITVPPGRWTRLVGASLALIGALWLADLRRDYRVLENALASNKNPQALMAARQALVALPNDSLLLPWRDNIACSSLDPARVAVEDGLAVCARAEHFGLPSTVMAQRAVLLWRHGQHPAALAHVDRMTRAHPGRLGEVRADLENAVSRVPDARPLLERLDELEQR